MRNEYEAMVELRIEIERLKRERNAAKDIAIHALKLAGDVTEDYVMLSEDERLLFGTRISAKLNATTRASELRRLADRYSWEVL